MEELKLAVRKTYGSVWELYSVSCKNACKTMCYLACAVDASEGRQDVVAEDSDVPVGNAV